MTAYYNEIDDHAADWLENLIREKLIAEGVVDRRSIVDVQPADLAGFVQCHFFAGIGGWSYALRLAGWSDNRPVWTGSCPCQALSSSARGRNVAVDRWPDWLPLIAANRPREIFGEQVAHKGDWLDRVCDDLEPLGYEIGAAVLPAISVGQDHIRHRIYFAGHAHGDSQPRRAINGETSRMSWPRGNDGGVVQANGVPSQVAVFRAFGNAIVPQLAAEFIRAATPAGEVP